MGDFFTRLAERTLGLAPVVQPDLMPVVAAGWLKVKSSAIRFPDWKKPSSARLRRGKERRSKRFDKPEHRTRRSPPSPGMDRKA